VVSVFMRDSIAYIPFFDVNALTIEVFCAKLQARSVH